MDDLTRRSLAYLRDHESSGILPQDRDWLDWLISNDGNVTEPQLARIARIRAACAGRRF